MKLSVQFGTPHITFKFGTPSLGISTGNLIIRDNSEFPVYDGSYEVTPTQQTQTLNTSQKVLVENVIINPIPSNYGLISYNGSVLTVS